MKRFLQRSSVLLLFFLLSTSLFAQLPAIISLTIIPANPTTHDSVNVVSQTMFPSGTCELTWSSVSISGGTIDVYVIHTLGMLTYICSSTDTLAIGKLESGNYKLRYHLSGTPYPPNTDLDSIYFTVQAYTGLNPEENIQPFSLFPNPSQSSVAIQFTDKTTKADISVFDLTGREHLKLLSSGDNSILDMSDLSKGVYLIRVKSGAKTGYQKLFKL
jgi:hypothetical protein